jgi:hypothetical protein
MWIYKIGGAFMLALAAMLLLGYRVMLPKPEWLRQQSLESQRPREPERPGVVGDPGVCGRSLRGNREVSCPTTGAVLGTLEPGLPPDPLLDQPPQAIVLLSGDTLRSRRLLANVGPALWLGRALAAWTMRRESSPTHQVMRASLLALRDPI